MKDILFDDFQNSVSELMLRHKSILDITSKMQEANARIQRAFAKAVTQCGCISIEANKDNLYLSPDHIKGTLCKECRDTLEKEIGNYLFYLMGFMNSTDINCYDVLIKEIQHINLLNKFNIG
ncbi:MAG: DUF1573 domain-containing protein [Clostridiales bacterium]|nr:DUF1573 domain-containing protein [Clostridiales bacterium]